MDDDLQYSQLTIAQGSGSNSNDTIIKYGSEYLAILKNIDASDIDYFDFTSMATGNQTLSGTSGDDVLIGAAGVDTVTSNTGADVILTHGGDDVITVDGTGNKTIDGGTGTDSLTISVSGISGLGDYTPTANGDYTVLTDSNNNVIQFKNIEKLTVGSYAYTNDTSDDTFWNSTEKALYMYDGGNTSSSSITSLSGFSASANLSVVGSGLADSMNLNIDRSSALTGNLTLSMGDGNDTLLSSKFKNSDSVDMGAGDDTIYVMVGGGSGTPDFGSFDMTKLDGGAGTDTLYFVESTTGGAELNLSIGGAVNFENLSGTQGSEIIRGNSGDNILYGNSGSDTIYGGAGNDIIAGNDQIVESDNATVNAKDNLYGEAGDDTLFGTDSDNILDGGAGSDKIYSGNGSDTIVLRAGDGGSTLAAADTINEFTDGSDVLGMDDDLQYSQLTIAQGSGSNSNDTIIKYGSEYLAILKNIDVDLLTEADFTPVDIA
jgi:Ca2+-binding RTX toxin-like protein